MHVRLHALALLCAGSLVSLPAESRAATTEEELAAVRSELAETKQQLADALHTLGSFEQRLDQLEGSQTAAVPAPSGPRIPPVNIDNPAVSFVVDTALKTDTEGSGTEFGLQSGELFISAPIDPFLRGYASINGTSEEFNLEEAAVVTTALPWNLTVKGGRFFADVGRMPHWHDEQLPFVDRPPSIDRLFGGESQAEGAEVTWLAPIEHYVSLTAGVYNLIGAEANEELREEGGFDGRRNVSELTWLVHPSTYFDLTDTLNLELGATYFTVTQDNLRDLYGFDLTLRHQPGTSELYQGFEFGSEYYWNDEKSDVEIGTDPLTGDPIFDRQRFDRNGGYAYLEALLGRSYRLGVRGDYAEDPFGESNRQRTYSAYATWFPSEFHRLRFQFDQIDLDGADDDQRFTLQWTAFLGSHAHGFANR
jgi:hypothetical protein